MSEENANLNNVDDVQDEGQVEDQITSVENDTPEEVPSAEAEVETHEEEVETEEVDEPDTKTLVEEGEESSEEPIDAEPVSEPEDEISSESQETPASDQESKPEEEPPAAELETAEKTIQPAYATRSQAFWMSAGCSFLTLILALVIGFAVLAGLNRGHLVFVSPEQVSELALEVERIDKVVNSLEQDLSSVQNRVDNLEALSGRLNEVEQTIEDLNKEMGRVSTQTAETDQKVQDLSQQTDILTTNVESLQENIARYQDFFNGLKELLSNLLTIEEGSDEQQPK